MATLSFSLLLLLLLSTQAYPKPLPTSPYLYPQKALFQDYQKMHSSFKIYTYPPPITFFNFSTPSESLFHLSLLRSPFRTLDPTEAHLFLVPFPSETPPRALTRYLKELRSKFPYWNRSLGADHFFISRTGISFSSDRNTLELKKNGIQISIFPTLSGNFIPHKDISLPPLAIPLAMPHAPHNITTKFLVFVNEKSQTLIPSGYVNELRNDPEFTIASGPLDSHLGKYCVFFYGGDENDVSWLVGALAKGCVPVVIVDRSIQDLPLMDVLRWAEMAVFVGVAEGVGGVKRVVDGIGEERNESMKRLGVAAARHLEWNADPQPLDAFHMVMYQLWTRRHTIRYARREFI